MIGSQDDNAKGIRTQLGKNPQTRDKVIQGLSEKHPAQLHSAVGGVGAPASHVATPTVSTSGRH
jgi:hypothetical protein